MMYKYYLSLKEVNELRAINIPAKFLSYLLVYLGSRYVCFFSSTQDYGDRRIPDDPDIRTIFTHVAESKAAEIETWYNRKRETYGKYLEYWDTFRAENVEQNDPENTIVTKTNDTPTDEGDYSEDKYTSNIVKTTNVQKRSGVQKMMEGKETLIDDTIERLIHEFYNTFVIEYN